LRGKSEGKIPLGGVDGSKILERIQASCKRGRELFTKFGRKT
jgi:hypothetical protein